MKALIWIGCFFIATILNTILGYATGIKIGYLIFYFAVYYVAKKLCNLWDEHKEKSHPKAAQQSTRFCKECGQKLLDNSKFCSKCGADTSNDDIIEQGNEKFCSVCGADVSHDKEYCHICYKKLNETDIKN